MSVDASSHVPVLRKGQEEMGGNESSILAEVAGRHEGEAVVILHIRPHDKKKRSVIIFFVTHPYKYIDMF